MRNQVVRGTALYRAAALAFAMAVAGCGGGGSAELVVVGGRASVPRLDIALSRPGLRTIQVDWSDDSLVDSFTITRNGAVLADDVSVLTLVDDSVVFNVEYCYQVFGYDRVGNLVSATDEACVIV